FRHCTRPALHSFPTRRSSDLGLSELDSSATVTPRLVSASEVVAARPARLVPLRTFTVMSSNATNVASSGGHGAVAVEVVGSGELIGTLNGLGRMPTHIAPEARPTTSIA